MKLGIKERRKKRGLSDGTRNKCLGALGSHRGFKLGVRSA